MDQELLRELAPCFPVPSWTRGSGIVEEVAVTGMSNIGQAEAIIIRAMVSVSLADSRQRGVHYKATPMSLIFRNYEFSKDPSLSK